ncbi:MAG: hypothetical protein DCF12_16390 [Snowella sp.]|nr:MAG: hypothetical protein DCF12_16390 [Snowella sp.]
MANQELLKIYKETFQKVSLKVESKDKGVMYEALKILLNANKYDLDLLVSQFGIKESSCFDEDQEIANRILNDVKQIVYVERLPLGDLNLSSIATKLSNQINQSKEKKMELIIIAACLMAGIFTCLRYLEKEESSKLPPGRSSLCLAVPSSAIYKLVKDPHLERNEIEKLIDSATEFKCVKESEEVSVEIDPNEKISSDSQLKFYVRIDLENGGNIIGKETQYGMKRELPLNVKGTIRELGFLKDVSILRKFNRV